MLWISLILRHPKVDNDVFLGHYVSTGAIIASIPGLLNLLIWCTVGMNAFLFYLDLALLLIPAAVVYLIVFICSLRMSTIIVNDDENSETIANRWDYEALTYACACMYI